jgi:hypothetical protein
LPLSAALQLTAFAIFFATVSRHKPASPASKRKPIEPWMKLVIASTALFLLALLVNQVETLILAMTGAHPEIPHWLDQRYLFLAGWGFPVLAVWGFNARWLPVFLGLREPSTWRLMTALCVLSAGLAAAAFGQFRIAALLLFCASTLAADGLHVFSAGPETSQDDRGLRILPDLREGFLCLALSRRCPWHLRGFFGYAWRHLGRVASCSHGRIPVYHGLRNRAESATRVLWHARTVQ